MQRCDSHFAAVFFARRRPPQQPGRRRLMGGGGGGGVDPGWLDTLLRVCLSPEQGHIRLLSAGFALGADTLGVSWCASIALGTALVRTLAAVGPPAVARSVTRQPWFRYEMKQRAREIDQRLMLLAAYEARRMSWTLAERDVHLRQLRAESPELRRLAAEFAALQGGIGLGSAALQAGVFICASAAVRGLCSSASAGLHPGWLLAPDPWCALPLATVALNALNFFWPRSAPTEAGGGSGEGFFSRSLRPRLPNPLQLPAGLPTISPALLTGGFACMNGLLLYIGWYHAPAAVALYWCCSAAHQTLLLTGMAAYRRWRQPK